METEKRMAENYEILHAISVGKKEVVFGCDEKAEYPYMTAFCERNDILIFYNDVVVSADYVEILEEFGKRVAEAAKDLREANEKESAYIGDNAPYDLARIEEISEDGTAELWDIKKSLPAMSVTACTLTPIILPGMLISWET